MADERSEPARRRFLKLAIGAAAALPACAVMARRLRAQERVDPSSELAQDVRYVEDADAIDPAEFPDYTQGEYCADCALYRGGEGDEWGPCDIFGGDLVAAKGWCTAFIVREA